MINPQETLQRHFGFSAFRRGQETAIRTVLEGRDSVVVMPTGAGKSLIYQLAALHLDAPVLVISPLIALMKDQVDALQRRDIAATFINSAITKREQLIRLRAFVEKYVKLLYVAPERLRNGDFQRALRRVPIGLLAIDEAHCVSQWGHDFRPDYLQIGPARAALNNPITVALTATATPQVQDDIERLLELQNPLRLVTGFNRPNLTFTVKHTAHDDLKYRALKQLLKDEPGAGIIYAGTRKETEEIAQYVSEVLKRPCPAYHAGVNGNKRTSIQEDFMQRRVNVVAATNAFGMGIDRADLRFVVHFNLPGTLEAYYQEAGRAGRDGEPAQCVLFYAPQDRGLQEWFIKQDNPAPDEVRALYQLLSRLVTDDVATATWGGLAQTTNLSEIKLRLALSQLEQMDAVYRLGDERRMLRLRVKSWDKRAAQDLFEMLAARRDHRYDQLERMVNYAETADCRRQIILTHFGDTEDAHAPLCCDNCLRRAADERGETRKAETQTEWAALLALDTAKMLSYPVGGNTLVKILRGSQARGMEKYARLQHYGRLAAVPRAAVKAVVNQLLEQSYLKYESVHNDTRSFTVVNITERGMDALRDRAALPIRVELTVTEADTRRARERKMGNTVEITKGMLARGLTPEEIAKERGLQPASIYRHCAQLIGNNELDVGKIVAQEVIEQVQNAAAEVGSTRYLRPLKDILPEDISYGEIQCVVAAMPSKADAPRKSRQLTAPDKLSAKAARLFEKLRQWRLQEARDQGTPPYTVFHDTELRAIAHHSPRTAEELKRIRGVGEQKTEAYGGTVLEIVREFA